MDASLSLSGHAKSGLRRGLAFLGAAALMLSLSMPALAADEPAPTGLSVEARALMAGNVRPGAWAAISVEIANDGPAMTGELRVRTPQQGRSVYGIAVDLPSGSRQAYTLYAQPPLFGTRLHVDLMGNGQAVLTTEVPVKSHDAFRPIIAVLAERPEGLLAGVNQVAVEQPLRGMDGQRSTVITVGIADLPPRVEAWSAIDRLVWQDIDARRLSGEQLDALRLWLSAGGQLVVVGGTTGISAISGFPDDLLPFTPQSTIDVPAVDLSPMLGQLPSDLTSVPSIGGTLRDGTVWARSGDHVIAAQSNVGQGSVTLVGVNPAEHWLSDTETGRSLWRRLLPGGMGVQVGGVNMADDSMLVGALNMLPSIDLPPIEQLFLLLFAYVALIGPINYVVLRRLDRREWAWITMPALVAIFAVGSYGMGASLKGSDVIVNEIAVIRASEGADQGVGQVYVGVFSPTRRSFDVRIADSALLTNPISQSQFGQPEQPLDVLFGETSRLRNFEVGFGLLRSFRAQAATAVPVIEADLRLVQGRLQGTVVNRSETALENVAVAYAGGVAVLDGLDPGESAEVNVDTSRASFGYQLSERIFGSNPSRDEAQARVAFARRSVIDQVTGYGPGIIGTSSAAPILLAWRPGPILDVELVGEEPNRVGDSLILVPMSMTLDREAVFTGQMISTTVLENTSGEGFAEGSSYFLSRGAMAIEIRPGILNGGFAVRSLELALTQGEGRSLRGNGTPIAPLPEEEQPDQDDPVGQPAIDPNNPDRFVGVPNLQLFDHAAGRWFEFPQFVQGRSYLIEEPERFVDGGGRVVARLVNRGVFNEQTMYFTLLVRLEGTIE